jgi:predicted DNA-binding transcriptional regulator AlpA
MPEKLVYTVAEVSALTGLSRQTVMQMLEKENSPFPKHSPVQSFAMLISEQINWQ